jgi:hypothetical protein
MPLLLLRRLKSVGFHSVLIYTGIRSTKEDRNSGKNSEYDYEGAQPSAQLWYRICEVREYALHRRILQTVILVVNRTDSHAPHSFETSLLPDCHQPDDRPYDACENCCKRADNLGP